MKKIMVVFVLLLLLTGCTYFNVSDMEYDQYIEQLKQLDPNNKLLIHIGGTRGKYRHKGY